MKITAVVLFFCIFLPVCLAQSASPKWQVATVIAAKVHQTAPDDKSHDVRYDVTLRVGNVDYVVLYTPPDGIDVVEYRLGRDGLVLVSKDTIKFNDLLGRSREVPIIRRGPVSEAAKR